ncbi:MAG: excinuclease ABC subunit UvrB [bacterium]|nr:excinuclease ABC subunit UvrB [bacterium]
MDQKFKLHSSYQPKGDQPQAISKLISGFKNKNRFVLLGVTGSGKTFTMANLIQSLNIPTLIISHNKTLAGQLYTEFKEYFPENAVEYFVSYYDFYQPEAYLPQTDTYIEKDASINDEIDRLRLKATTSLLTRNDVIIVSSVSCIYGLGSPEDFKTMILYLKTNMKFDRDAILQKLVALYYERNDIDFGRGTFRVRGDIVEVHPADSDYIIRIEFLEDNIERISKLELISKKILNVLEEITIFPRKHFITPQEKVEKACKSIEAELEEHLKELNKQNKILEAHRLETKTRYDLEMIREIGYCSGIENYSRHFSDRAPGERPSTLLDYFNDDFLVIIDESHVTIPQLRGMYAGDRSRKETLINYGFRLPSAFDNRPLVFEEFNKIIKKVLYVSATPSRYEIENADEVVEQIVRPTGLIEPKIIIQPVNGQIEDLLQRIKLKAEKGERTLITTLTKRMSEDLSDYLFHHGIKVCYLHSEIEVLERFTIIRDLRLGKYDCLVGINLLREGLDLPEVSLVAILDADKEGFLHSVTSLIQVCGRAARHINGEVVMYANSVTESMKKAIEEIDRRRKLQIAYNDKHNITPLTIIKSIPHMIEGIDEIDEVKEDTVEYTSEDQIKKKVAEWEVDMFLAVEKLDFEKAAELRDKIRFYSKNNKLFKK